MRDNHRPPKPAKTPEIAAAEDATLHYLDVHDFEGMKQCPECAELVRGEARKCRFCGYEFGSFVSPEELAAVGSEGPLRQPERVRGAGFFIVAIGLSIFVVAVVLAAVYAGSR